MDRNQIQQLVTQGRTIEAIKLYRQIHGVGLKDAKDAADAMARGETPASKQPIADDTERQVYEALYTGHKIEAIRLWRLACGDGLKESKDFIDALEADLRAESPEKFTAAPKRIGCTTMVVLSLTLIGVMAFLWR